MELFIKNLDSRNKADVAKTIIVFKRDKKAMYIYMYMYVQIIERVIMKKPALFIVKVINYIAHTILVATGSSFFQFLTSLTIF